MLQCGRVGKRDRRRNCSGQSQTPQLLRSSRPCNKMSVASCSCGDFGLTTLAASASHV